MSIKSLLLCLCKAESELLEFKTICFAERITKNQVPSAPELLAAVQMLLDQCADLKQQVQQNVQEVGAKA